MKRFALTAVIITLIFEILVFPKEAMSFATTGLSLWFDTMIPALFPFMVISSLIIRLDLSEQILSVLHPLLLRIFQTNHYCEYAIVMGFLCGYPMGAVIVRDLLTEEKITVSQADYLLAFCNNIGPVFFCSVILPLFERKYHFFLLTGMYFIPLLYGLILRYTAYKNIRFDTISKTTKRTGSSFSNAFTGAINQSVSSVLFLGACMIFFNMLRFLPAKFGTDNLVLQTFLSWLLEVNGALINTGLLIAGHKIIPAFCMLPLLQIGGLSCIAQTAGILSERHCNLLGHFIHKCIQALFWFLLMCSALLLFPE